MPRAATDVLIAVLGTSPAVLTETVWALAHETPACLPHRVSVITTTVGKTAAEKILFEDGGWSRLIQTLEKKRIEVSGRLQFGPAADHLRLLPRPDGRGDLEDIVKAAESMAAADFIMRTLREVTEDPDTRVIASIAGGRKTMGALLTSCMVLLGRAQDRLCHVLVSPPYDSPQLTPLFLYPEPHVIHRLPGSDTRHPSGRARIDLTDIPFVRTRGWYEREYLRPPSSYMTLVRRFQACAPEAANYPVVDANVRTGRLRIGGEEIALSPCEFAATLAVLERAREEHALTSWEDIRPRLIAMREERGIPPDRAWQHDFAAGVFDLGPKSEDVRKAGSRVRRKLRALSLPCAVVRLLMPDLRHKGGALYPACKIRFTGDR